MYHYTTSSPSGITRRESPTPTGEQKRNAACSRTSAAAGRDACTTATFDEVCGGGGFGACIILSISPPVRVKRGIHDGRQNDGDADDCKQLAVIGYRVSPSQ
ncbi:hypothetical protein QTP88_026139 [Uroleucon formosanum]